jgi:hypothetical protein
MLDHDDGDDDDDDDGLRFRVFGYACSSFFRRLVWTAWFMSSTIPLVYAGISSLSSIPDFVFF